MIRRLRVQRARPPQPRARESLGQGRRGARYQHVRVHAIVDNRRSVCRVIVDKHQRYHDAKAELS